MNDTASQPQTDRAPANAQAAPAAVEVTGLSKNYGRVEALKNVDLSIAAGEYFVLLGPSGGGKTTLLRLIGGFIKPTAGQVRLHGHDVSRLPPERRPTSMVFQSYALFPHMSVARNVGYGLRIQKTARAEAEEKVAATLEMVGLDGYGDRMPHELSGGQQQRVQLARAFVLERDILLLDEPLAALDAKLRKDMCLELKHLQEQVGITFIHVTHNQEEAMTVADRLAIIADGELIEAGTARQVYQAPRRRFTADFIGENNLLEGRLTSASGASAEVDLGYAAIQVPIDPAATAPAPGDVTVSIRSEGMHVSGKGARVPDGREQIAGTYEEPVYLGLTTSHMVRLPDGGIVSVRSISGSEGDGKWSSGDDVILHWDRSESRLHLD